VAHRGTLHARGSLTYGIAAVTNRIHWPPLLDATTWVHDQSRRRRWVRKAQGQCHCYVGSRSRRGQSRQLRLFRLSSE